MFDDPQRDTRGHVVSVAHADLLPQRTLTPQGPWVLAPVDRGRAKVPGRGQLLYDHQAIIGAAVGWAQERYGRWPDPSRLLPEPFTLRELRVVHEAVLGVRLQKDTFRRAMVDRLVEAPERSSGTPGRPAAKYRHAPRKGPV